MFDVGDLVRRKWCRNKHSSIKRSQYYSEIGYVLEAHKTIQGFGTELAIVDQLKIKWSKSGIQRELVMKLELINKIDTCEISRAPCV